MKGEHDTYIQALHGHTYTRTSCILHGLRTANEVGWFGDQNGEMNTWNQGEAGEVEDLR